MKPSKYYGSVIPQEFYNSTPDDVAIRLLGKLLLRRWRGKLLGGMITEVEAYFGPEDPASRASKGGVIGEAMNRPPGHTLIYMVHANWLLNIVTLESKPSAVLIRSIEPLVGVEEMYINRGIKDIKVLTTGPGRLTKALNIDKSLDGIEVFNEDSELFILYYMDIEDREIGRSKRIGVTKDLEEPYRFYILENPFVSKK